MKTLIIIPVYNEALNLPLLFNSFSKLNNPNFELLVVDDHSQDKSIEICIKYNIPYISLPKNYGSGAAIKVGIHYALQNAYTYAIQFDGDGQHDPASISDLLEPLINNKAQLVIGSRFIEKRGYQSSFWRRLGIIFLSKIIYLFARITILDPTSGLRAFHFSIFKSILSHYPDRYPEPESILKLSLEGIKIMEIPVKMNPRFAGKSTLNPIDFLWKVMSGFVYLKLK